MKKMVSKEYRPAPELAKNNIPKGAVVEVIGQPVEGRYVAIRYKSFNYMITIDYLTDIIEEDSHD